MELTRDQGLFKATCTECGRQTGVVVVLGWEGPDGYAAYCRDCLRKAYTLIDNAPEYRPTSRLERIVEDLARKQQEERQAEERG